MTTKRVKTSLFNGEACADPMAFMPNKSYQNDANDSSRPLFEDHFNLMDSPIHQPRMSADSSVKPFFEQSAQQQPPGPADTKDSKGSGSKPGLFPSKEEEDRKTIGKQVSKIKYFWRGTNMNYPFAFQRVRYVGTNHSKRQIDFDNLECVKGPDSEDEDHNEEGIVYEEDLSNKVINPADKFYK